MKNPMGYILLFLLIGIIAGQYLHGFGGIALFALAVGCAMLATYARCRYRWSIMLVAVSVVGFISGSYSVREVAAPTTVLTGEVVDRRELEGGSYRYIVELTDSKDRLYMYDGGNYTVGSVVSIDGEIKDINSKRNPVDFDTRMYYRARGIYHRINGKITALKGINRGFGYCCDRLRVRLEAVYDSILPEGESALVKAMVLGDKSAVDSQTYDDYRQSGIIHILCVSGLHISLIGHIIMLLLKRWLNRWVAIPSFIAVLMYCCLSGWSVSAARAAIMFGIYTVGKLIFRRSSVLYSACLAAVILLLYSPCYLYDMGFQYSFTCVMAIGMALEVTEYYGITDRRRQSTLLTMVVTLCCKPLTIYYYYRVSVIDVAANVIAVPLVAFVVIFGAVGGFVGLFSLSVARIIIYVPHIILKLYDIIVQGSVASPLSEAVTGGISGYALVAVMLCFVAAYLVLTDNIGRWWLAAVLPTLALLYRPKVNSVDFLYIGHGDCAVVSYGEYTALIDAGSTYNSSYGTRTILPYIYYLGKERIDEVYISHLDYDHIGGLYDMLGKVDIGRIVTFRSDGDKYNKLKALADEYGIELVTPECGEVYRVKDKLSYSILAPKQENISDNDSSMVMMLESGNERLLFTGDIEEKGEKSLIDSGYSLECDVLKLPHHGARSNKTEELLSATKPTVAIAGVGVNDRYNHPAQETVDSVAQGGAELYTTANNGTIRINLDNGKIKKYIN